MRIPLSAAVYRGLFALLIMSIVAGCGFHLRGSRPLPFESIFVNMPDNSELGVALKRTIQFSGVTRLAATPSQAQAIFEPLADSREKVILSLNASGRVREYQLRHRFAFRVHDGKGGELLPPGEITLTRDISYSDAQVLAKEQEETLLYTDMQNDLVFQILRRLSTAKRVAQPLTPAAP